jgi:hypothetical protein
MEGDVQDDGQGNHSTITTRKKHLKNLAPCHFDGLADRQRGSKCILADPKIQKFRSSPGRWLESAPAIALPHRALRMRDGTAAYWLREVDGGRAQLNTLFINVIYASCGMNENGPAGVQRARTEPVARASRRHHTSHAENRRRAKSGAFHWKRHPVRPIALPVPARQEHFHLSEGDYRDTRIRGALYDTADEIAPRERCPESAAPMRSADLYTVSG